MTPGRRMLAALVTLCGVVTPAPAAPAVAAEPPPLTWALRHSASGWIGLASAGAAVLACPDATPGCTDPAGNPVGTGWLDVDGDAGTFASSRSRLTLPPRATVEWAGLFWTGDRATTRDGSPARCDAAPPGAAVTAPPAPDRADRVKIRIGTARYSEVKAVDVRTADGPASAGFQGYTDVTALLRPAKPPAQALPLDLTVADVQAAAGIGCAGGWYVLLVYAYPDGPNATHAPAYRSISIFDGIATVTAAAAPAIKLDGLLTGAEPMDPLLIAALLASAGPVARDTVTVNGAAVAGTAPPGSTDGFGYRAVGLAVPEGLIPPRSTSVTLGFGPVRDGYLAGAVAVATRLPVRVDLAVTTTVAPESVPVGGRATVTVAVRNDADIAATGVAITTHLATGLAVLTPPAGYDPGTGVWTVGTVPPGATRTLTLPVRVDAVGSFVSTAEVTASDTPDLDSTPGDGPGQPGEGTVPQDDFAQATLTGIAPQTTPTVAPTEQPAAVPPQSGLPLNIPPVALFGVAVFAVGLMLLMIALRRRSV